MRSAVKIRSLIAGLLYGVATLMTIAGMPAAAQDVQAYCARVGNDDRLQTIPNALLSNARRVFEVEAGTADSYIQATTSVRCMNGTVWLCSYGANLICEKADVSRDSPGAERYCRHNPGSIDVPMSATGHATVYDWKCVGREARIVGPIVEVDGRGFIAGNWKPLK